MCGKGHIRDFLRLTLADGIGAKNFTRLVDAFGSPSAVASAGPGAWKQVEGIGPKTVAAMQAVSDEVIDSELDLAEKLGVSIFCLDDEEYPKQLKYISTAPPVLYVRGRIEPADAVSMAIVGSRRCSHYGLEQAERFGGLLGRAGFTVISGGARGIDTAAHRGAVYVGGRTIAVMGCGLEHVYPAENKEFFEQIVAEDRGAIVSELPLRVTPNSGNFPARNRIISGLSLGVLVVEAGLPSGALITAREAAEQGRDVFAVPGRVDSPQSSGTHQLLRDGAVLTADLDDILGALGEVSYVMGEKPAEVKKLLRPENLMPSEAKLFGLLEQRAMTLDELVQASGLDAGKTAGELTMLALKGLVQRQPGNIFSIKLPDR